MSHKCVYARLRRAMAICGKFSPGFRCAHPGYSYCAHPGYSDDKLQVISP